MSEEAPPPVAPPEKTIPYDRFQAVVGEKNTLKTRLADAEKQIQALTEKGATVDTIAGQLKATKAQHAAELSKVQEELGLSRAGLNDPTGAAIARTLHGLLPEADRPSLLDYVGSFRGEDAPEPPPGLAPYLGLAPKPPAKEEKPAGEIAQLRQWHTPPAPRSTPPGAPNVTAAAIKAAREKGASTGDWSEFRGLTGAANGS